MLLRVLSIVGARPNFIKMAPIIQALKQRKHESILLHTGQHYDFNMATIFFKEFEDLKADYNLGVGSGTHAYQTGEMLKGIEKVILEEEPNVVLVPGDTNTTIAGALAATKLHVKVAHVEAGLRSYDKRMPEEINRILTDHCSDILLCPTQTAITNLAKEGIKERVALVGDTMYELALKFQNRIEEIKLEITLPQEFILATIHRAKNVGERLGEIMKQLIEIELPVIMPIHPRTKKKLLELGLYEKVTEKLKIIEPLGYLEFSKLLKKAKIVITDSGGVQKEAYWNEIPCITVRDNTEWIETLKTGANILVKPEKIAETAQKVAKKRCSFDKNLYGFLNTSERIVKYMEEKIENKEKKQLTGS